MRLNARAASVTADAINLEDGATLPCDLAVGVAGARAQGWLAETGLALTDGFIDVDPTLASTTDPAIFAAGDCAHLTHAPRAKAGVYAVRAAPVLLHNLKAALSGGNPRPYHPQRDYLKLVSTGGKRAVADKWGLPLAGAWLWRWKDRIDRRFMTMLQDLPAMPPAPLPARAATGLPEELAGKGPLCGGCAAKVGGADLAEMLAKLPRTQRDEVLRGAGDDAAVLRAAGGVQVITTDHLRAFAEDPVLMTRIAAIHALGDVWAMGAAPQVALAQVILPRLSQRLQARTLAEIMATAAEVMAEAGAEIVGGHTSVGAELTVGFTLTGTAPRATGLGGAQAGDALLLTKPLGTGVILAAEMQYRAEGSVVAGALASMACSPARDAALLAPLAHAMTDVTGFGLAGHLLSMLDASALSAEISLAALPVLPGAEALLDQGQRATLHEANRTGASRIAAPATPRGEILFDPQTAGGFLVALPPRDAKEVLTALRNAGVDAAIIGRLMPGPVAVTVTG
ncbi:MAG: selenide, water dikinase SelD [Paracoccaceae bacterium]